MQNHHVPDTLCDALPRPRDPVVLEAEVREGLLTDHRLVLAREGKELLEHLGEAVGVRQAVPHEQHREVVGLRRGDVVPASGRRAEKQGEGDSAVAGEGAVVAHDGSQGVRGTSDFHTRGSRQLFRRGRRPTPDLTRPGGSPVLLMQPTPARTRS